MLKKPLDDLAVACGAADMVSPFTHPKGPRTAVKFKVDDGSLERFAAAVVADHTALLDAVGKLIKAKGRFHTEQNYLALVAAYDAIKEKA